MSILKDEAPQILFRTGLSLVHQLTKAFADRLVAYGVVDADKIAKNVSLHRPGVILAALDQTVLPVLGMNRVEILKGAFNRFPVRPLYVSATRVGSDGGGAPAVGTREAASLEFTPIDTLAALRSLAESLDGISGMLQVASLALDNTPIGAKSVDGVILRSLARAVFGGGFEISPLTDEEIKRLGDMPKSDAAKVLDEVLTGIEGTLRLALVPGSSQGEEPRWPVSRDAQIFVDDPTVDVVRELGALKEQFMLALEHGHLFELLQETLS